MIKSFADRDTKDLFEDKLVKHFKNIERIARRKLEMLDAACVLADLKSPPGNKLELLKGVRQGQYSIRINDQYRICFGWSGSDGYDVEIVDYHK